MFISLPGEKPTSIVSNYMSLTMDKQPPSNYNRMRIISSGDNDCSNFRFGTGKPPLFARYLSSFIQNLFKTILDKYLGYLSFILNS